MTTMTTPTIETRRSDVDGDEGPDCAHYAPKAEVTRAYVTGETIIALCGRAFVPTKNPDGLPICQACAEIKSR